MVSALAFSARGHGFDPRGRRKISVSEHAFLSVIYRYDTISLFVLNKPVSIPAAGEKFRCPNMLSLASFTGMTL